MHPCSLAGNPLRRRARHRWWPAAASVAVLGVLLLAGCGSSGSSSSFQEEVRQFRETHVMCSERHYRRPCQIGPDGRLYRYLPGEHDKAQP